MKSVLFKAILAVLMVVAIQACSNKKQENYIKSLEKRVAALEGKSDTSSEVIQANENEAVNSTGEIAQMTFEKTEYDFGSVKEGEIVDYTYKFTNTGSTMLIISKATATCGCTVPEWPKEPIRPGGTGEIRVKFDSKSRKNLQTKYVNINANTSPEVTRLKLTGNVVPNDDSNS
jgi:hypothetical protein